MQRLRSQVGPIAIGGGAPTKGRQAMIDF